MFKPATRYLSGVSVFYGDDITRREIDGEIAMIVGPAFKGPKVPIALKSIDNTIPLYGTNCPLSKTAYQFWDGYLDSEAAAPVRLVTLRVGGIAAKLTTSYGLSLETTDAYDGIENDFYIYVDNTSLANRKVKVWDANKMIVLDTSLSIDSAHVTITSMPDGEGGTGAIYGKDIDNDPLATPITIAELVNWDLVNPTGSVLKPTAVINASTTSLVVLADADANLIPVTGTLAIRGINGAITYLAYVPYTNFDVNTMTFTLDSEVGVSGFASVDPANIAISLVGSLLVQGDSEMNLSKRELYEKFKNTLLEVEQYTPDYILPAGVAYNETDTYVKTSSANTMITQAVPSATSGTSPQDFVVVDAASNWPAAGVVSVSDGVVVDTLRYTAVTVVGTEDYRLNIVLPSFKIKTAAVEGDATLELQDGANAIAELNGSGYLKIGNEVYAYVETGVDGLVDITPSLSAAGALVATAGASVQKVIGEIKDASAVGTTRKVGAVITSTVWQSLTEYELGIGYCQEIDKGDHFEFKWSDTKLPNYFLAHFGYLMANFCNEAAVGYNTPLCGMNVKTPVATDRASIVQWIGSYPESRIVAGNADAVEAITKNGKGLLGEPTLAGSVQYNRCYMNDRVNNEFVDPAYGLLLTDEGFVDGHEIKDDFSKVVDLGKFMAVGAGLLTFQHRASGVAYIDACGVYAMGVLAGTAKGEGISFRKIGTNSNATVGVVVHRKLYNDLAGLGYIVPTREKGLGWVINNDTSVARNDSGYYLISTTKTIKAVVEGKRSVLVSFIGKPVNKYFYEAARTKIADSFKSDMTSGLLNGYTFQLQVAKTTRAIGKLYLKCSLNPPLELVQVDIDTVIDHNVIAGE